MSADFGVYVHVPFCRHRCDYCAFATYVDRDPLMDRYVEACRTQLRRAAGDGGLRRATSVFFGGGTPSRLDPQLLAALLAEIPRAPGAEVTVECNPEDATGWRFETYLEAGVTRLSLGVQSTRPAVLASLGRRHDPSAVDHAVRLAAGAGFSSWSVDLIFGAVDESEDDWKACLHDVLAWTSPPPHLSVYALTAEPGTPLGRQPERHPDPDVQARRYEMTDELLTGAGYRWEEISNWARPGHQCRHNQLYWAQGDYLGVGSAAHSHAAGRRWWNRRTPERFIDAVESGQSPVAGAEVLSPGQRTFEAAALSLRTPAGVPAELLPESMRVDLEDLVMRHGDRVVLTRRGRLLANEVTARLVAAPVTSPP